MRTSKLVAILATALIGVGCMGAGISACGGNSGTGGQGSGDSGEEGDGAEDATTESSTVDTGVDSTTMDTGAKDTGAADTGKPPGDGGAGDGAPITDANLMPDVIFGNDSGCLMLGNACASNGDCCTGLCSNGACVYPPCVSVGGNCGAGSDCCSLTCDAGKCQSISNCGTLGNSCTTGSDCCSSNCVGSKCQPSAWCGQAGEICATNSDCCTGVCNVPSGSAVGTCASSPPGGAVKCGLADGMLCSGSQLTADGGVVYNDSGIPTCGGACCSRSCAPWGPTGILVCQPVSGCKVEGDLCTSDGQCCGAAGSGLPGACLVYCQITGDAGVGVCSHPSAGNCADGGQNTCLPNGAACKLATMSCTTDCNCCSGNCNNQNTCKQDNDGVPRCANAQCGDGGSSCASSADCCNGLPCVPGPDGGLTCYKSQCVPSCGVCTNTGDCCPGYSCINGACDPCTPPSDAGTDGAPSDGAAPDGGIKDSGSDVLVTCSQYGQLCTTDGSTQGDCCAGLACAGGRCTLL